MYDPNVLIHVPLFSHGVAWHSCTSTKSLIRFVKPFEYSISFLEQRYSLQKIVLKITFVTIFTLPALCTFTVIRTVAIDACPIILTRFKQITLIHI